MEVKLSTCKSQSRDDLQLTLLFSIFQLEYDSLVPVTWHAEIVICMRILLRGFDTYANTPK